MLVRSLNPTAFAAGVLKPDDVIMQFDGIDISCDGTVAFRTGERIAFSYLISKKFVGDTAQLQVLRDGQVRRWCSRAAGAAFEILAYREFM